MTRLKLFPYPRIDTEVEWSPLSATIDGRATSPSDLTQKWDRNTTISLALSASVPGAVIEEFGSEKLLLELRAGCLNTATYVAGSSPFAPKIGAAIATVTVRLTGDLIAHEIDVQAVITAPFGNETWLGHRIIAEFGVEKISLDSSQSGFPTSAISFSENRRPEAPWSVNVIATDLSDSFIHSVRLELNADFPRVRDLIEGRGEPVTKCALDATILRTILLVTRKLADDAGNDEELESIPVLYPDSFAAAADKASRDYLKISLRSAIGILRRRPEDLDTLIDQATRFLKD